MMSNCTRMTEHSWSYRLLNVKLAIVFVKFQVWWQKASNSPHFISTSISVCKAQSFVNHLSKSHNLKASPFRAIWSFERHDNCKMLLACFLRVLHIPPSLAYQYEGAVGQLTFVEFDYPDNTVDKKKEEKRPVKVAPHFSKLQFK